MSIRSFIETKEKLVHCPSCGAKLFDNPDNRAMRMCLVHGGVFAVMLTSDGSYHVEVDLAEC